MMASKRGRKETSCSSYDDNDGGGREHDPILPCFHEEVLDVVSELIFVASLPLNFCIDGDNDCDEEENTLHAASEFAGRNINLGDTKYINSSLCKVLGYPKGSVPPPGILMDLILKDGEYHGKIMLEDFVHKRIF